MYTLFAFILVCFIIALPIVIKYLYEIHLDKKQQDENFKSGNLSLSDKIEVVNRLIYLVESGYTNLLSAGKLIFTEHNATLTYNIIINNFFILHQKLLFSIAIDDSNKSAVVKVLRDYLYSLEAEIDNQEFNNE